MAKTRIAKTRMAVNVLLFLLFAVLEISGLAAAQGVPWARDLSDLAALPLVVLVWLFTRDAETTRDQLSKVVSESQKTLTNMTETRDELGRLRDDVDRIHQQSRVSDATFHGKVLFYEQRWDDAAEIFRGVIQEQPTNTELQYWLGLCLLRAEKPLEAVGPLTAAADGGCGANAKKALGDAEYRLGRTGPAETHLQQALDEGAENRADTMLLLGKVMARRDPERAKALLGDVVDRYPYNGNAIAELSDILTSEGKCDEAVDLCTKGIKTNSRNWAVYPHLAKAYLERDLPGDREKATDALRHSRLGNPKDYTPYQIEGADLAKQAAAAANKVEQTGLLDQAVKVYEDGLKRVPGTSKAPLHTGLSYVFLMRGDISKAEEQGQSAVALNSNHIENHLALCAARLAEGRSTALIKAARDARGAGGRAGRIWSLFYEILGVLIARDRVKDVAQELQSLASELRAMPKFDPTIRRDWPYASMAIAPSLAGLDGKEGALWDAIVQYLDGRTRKEDFIKFIEGPVS